MTVWRRKGLILPAPQPHPWWKRRAGVPTCLPLHDRLWRIWFGGVDANGRTGVLSIDVDPGDGMKTLVLRDVPGLERGDGDAFDSAGLWLSAVLRADGRVWGWYTGMRLGGGVPYELAIGLAMSDDDGLTFRKVGDGPVFTGAAGAPQFVTTPSVRRAGAGFEMWYSRGTEWRLRDGRREPFYDLCRATSGDGVTWKRQEQPVIGLDGTSWAGLTRPWVTADEGGETLWFSARGARTFRDPSPDAYHMYEVPLIGGAVREEDIRPVAFAPPPAPGDWDEWMQVCPCVLSLGSIRVMLYNGNDFSGSGVGYAIEDTQ